MKSLFDLPILSDQEIEEKKYSSSDLWLLKFKMQVIGPFHTETLIQFAHDNQQIMEQVLACSFSQDSWTPFYQNPRFQRRTPKLIKAQTLIQSDEFLLLIDGQKQGPFTSAQINEKLDKGEILSSDEASLDKGETWFKIYEHHSFDRRTQKSSSDIPFSPKENELIDKKIEVVDNYELPIVRGQEEFIRLAHFARNNQPEDKKIPIEKTKTDRDTKKAEVLDFPKEQYQNPLKRYTYGILACLFFAVVFGVKVLVFDTKENPNYSFEYKKQPVESVRKPASINRKKPIVQETRKPISKNIRKKIASQPKKRIRSRQRTNTKRVKNYHRKDDVQAAGPDPYQELIDSESKEIIDTNRPEDKEFLNDLKREIANEKENYPEDREMEERDDYRDDEPPIVEKDDQYNDEPPYQDEPREDY